MIINKAMIDLIKEIRRRCSPDIKPSIKLANPDVLDEIFILYENSNDVVLRALAKELFSIAGSPWNEKVNPPKVKEEAIVNNDEPETDFTDSVKIYRGVVIK